MQSTQFITLSSVDRNTGTAGDCTFRIPGLNLPQRYVFWLVSAQVPTTFYYLPSGYNTVYYRETGAITATASFTITPGSYSSSQLAGIIEDGLNANSPNAGDTNYTCTYSANTGKFTISTGHTTTVKFMNTMSKKLFLAMGFYTEAQGDYTVDDAQDGTAITSSSVAFSGPTHLTLETSLRCRGYHSTHKDGNVLATVPITVGFNEYLTFEPDAVYHFVEHDTGGLSQPRFTWRRDDIDDTIDTFNGVPWTITLGIRGVDEQ